VKNFNVIVVGSGLSGLYGALLASRHGDVLVLTKARLEDCNTFHAQGGIAVALASTDSPDLHFRDTIEAGAGLCDSLAVRILVEDGPRRVRDLIDRGVRFDREDGQIALTREAAHSQPRVLHAGGDATGASIEATIAEQVQSSPRVTVHENCLVRDLLVDGDRVVGVEALDCATGELTRYTASAIVLATGGAGQLFSQTTNPDVATGDGIALAFRAGAELADVEFFQFHPTALAVPGAPRFLISEAVRGEGGILRNGAGERFMPGYDERAELAPRDVVARSIMFEIQRTGDPCAYLDVTHLDPSRFRERFPTISRVCQKYGVDVARQPIPVTPAAHYFMGGIRTNLWGETSLPGLYACGECACTGVHGANRLASNSLLETIVFSARVAERLLDRERNPNSDGNPLAIQPAPGLLEDLRVVVPSPSDSDGNFDAPAFSIDALRDLTWKLGGLSRNAAGLARLESIAANWQNRMSSEPVRSNVEMRNLTQLARLLALAGVRREESRGAHYRTDFPRTDPQWRRRIVLVNGKRTTQGVTSERIRSSVG